MPRIPIATYRLQLNHTFTFRDATRIIPYLHALGITDCYTSSLLKAVPGSMHGYDLVCGSGSPLPRIFSTTTNSDAGSPGASGGSSRAAQSCNWMR